MDQEQVDSVAPPGKPALVVNIYSWATPIAAMVMLILGLVAGFYAYPLFDQRTGSVTNLVNPTSAPDTVAIQPTATDPAAAATAQASMMEYIVQNTNHFIGSEDAQVTIIEFSDFQ